MHLYTDILYETCPKTMVGGKQGTPENTFAPTKPLFMYAEFHGDDKTVINLR